MHSSASRGSQREAGKRGELTNVQRSYENVEGTYSKSEQVTKQHEILHALNNFLRYADGRFGPARSQLSTNADNVSSSTARYYKRGRENKYARFGIVEFRFA